MLCFAKFLLVCALMISIGGHWLVLQSVAWTTMLAANLANHASVRAAVSETFDGEHPCPLCKVVRAGKQAEQKSELPSPTLKQVEFVHDAPRFVFVSPSQFTRVISSVEFLVSFSFAPPVPPPRGDFV
ncbi:MAG: hypothetical protein RLZZ350_2288 [Verrucomicrobiota bacterium]